MSQAGINLGGFYVEGDVKTEKMFHKVETEVSKIEAYLKAHPLAIDVKSQQAQLNYLKQVETSMQQQAVHAAAMKRAGLGGGENPGESIRNNPFLIATRQVSSAFGVGQVAQQVTDIVHQIHIGKELGGIPGMLALGGGAAVVGLVAFVNHFQQQQQEIINSQKQYNIELKKTEEGWSNIARSIGPSNSATSYFLDNITKSNDALAEMQEDVRKTSSAFDISNGIVAWSEAKLNAPQIEEHLKEVQDKITLTSKTLADMSAAFKDATAQEQAFEYGLIQTQTALKQIQTMPDFIGKGSMTSSTKFEEEENKKRQTFSVLQAPARSNLKLLDDAVKDRKNNENALANAKKELADYVALHPDNEHAKLPYGAGNVDPEKLRLLSQMGDAQEKVDKNADKPGDIPLVQQDKDAKDAIEASTALFNAQQAADLKQHNLEMDQIQRGEVDKGAALWSQKNEADISVEQKGYDKQLALAKEQQEELNKERLRNRPGMNKTFSELTPDEKKAQTAYDLETYQKQAVAQDHINEIISDHADIQTNVLAQDQDRLDLAKGIASQIEIQNREIDRQVNLFHTLTPEEGEAQKKASGAAATGQLLGPLQAKADIQTRLYAGIIDGAQAASETLQRLQHVEKPTADAMAALQDKMDFEKQISGLNDQFEVLTGAMNDLEAAANALSRSGLGTNSANAIASQQNTNKWKALVDQMTPFNKLRRDAFDISQADLSVEEKRLALMQDVASASGGVQQGKFDADDRASLMNVSAMSTGVGAHGESSVQGQILNTLIGIMNQMPKANQIPGAIGGPLGPPAPGPTGPSLLSNPDWFAKFFPGVTHPPQ